MPVPLDQFVKHLEDSGIFTGDTLTDFIPPKAFPKDAEELARELVRKKKLTTFQAEVAYKGKAKSLVLGNYLVLEKVGQWGMGEVFRAEHRLMKRIVAINIPSPRLMRNSTDVARFQRWVELVAKLRHPNIVGADDADQVNGLPFAVMEFVEGSDLSALVKEDGPLPVAQAVNYILQAANGLGFAHKEGIVHGDVKPANLLVNTEGTVKVLDIGLARFEERTANQAELPGSGAIRGTVDYIAADPALSTEHADVKADIYSLGCSLFYLLTGTAAYDGEPLNDKSMPHQEHSIPSIRAIRADVPEVVEAIFNRMVAKKGDRYQTMGEVIVDLEACGKVIEQSAIRQRQGDKP